MEMSFPPLLPFWGNQSKLGLILEALMPRMRLTLAELLDRYTIEHRKAFYGYRNEQLLMELSQEIWGQIANIIQPATSVNETATKLCRIIDSAALLGIYNSDIANLEWQARAGQQLSLEEHGRRSQIIRYINDKGRTAVKQNLSITLKQNVETRHYGYGNDLKASDLTLDVQEPGERLRADLNKAGFDIPDGARITGIDFEP